MRGGKRGPGRGYVDFIYRNLKIIILGLVILISLLFSYIVWQQARSSVKSLINADIETLKGAFFGEKPFVYYCHERGKLDYVPAKLIDAHKIMGPKYGLAILNCSQELPSGKDIFTRFKLKKEWNPSIFATAPWTKPKQLSPRNMKDAKVMAESLVYHLQPRAVLIQSDKEFKDSCSFGSNESPVCFVVSKGSRWADGQDAMVATMVEQYPKNRILLVDAKVRRFSHDKTDQAANPDHYAMRLTAVRNGTHYLTMDAAPTWTAIQKFMSSTLQVRMTMVIYIYIYVL